MTENKKRNPKDYRYLLRSFIETGNYNIKTKGNLEYSCMCEKLLLNRTELAYI